MRGPVHRSIQAAAQLPLLRAPIYIGEAIRFARAYGGFVPVRRWLAEYAEWRDSQARRVLPLATQTPWVTFGAIQFLRAGLQSDDRVFEYGSGGSTLFLGLRCAEVISVEHDKTWSAQVREALKASDITNCTILDIPPGRADTLGGEPSDPRAYVSSDEQFQQRSFQAYASAIDTYADRSFRLVLVDGRARPSCCLHALPKVMPGGVLMLDNSERPHYSHIFEDLSGRGWRVVDFSGPGPYNRYFWRTTAWIRPAL